MKKAMWFLIISVLFIGDVSARQLTDGDIDANSIVIGTHLFEYGETNDDIGYTGTINTRFAMLGAASISSDTVSDMKIYYKVMNGFWMDYLTKSKVTIPDSFKICYINGTFTGDDDCERGSGEIPGEENIVNVTFKASDFNETKKVPVKKGTTISPDNAPDLRRKLGFKLDFWSKEGETTAFDFTKPINEDITLEVNWKPIQYKIYYHSNFGEDVTKEVACNYESAENKCTLKRYLDVLADNDFVGNEFEGWSLTPIKAGLIPAEKTMDDIIGDAEEFHLYAIWKLNSYTLTYNNGAETLPSITCVYNNVCKLDEFTPVSRNGYAFDYWYFEETNGEEVTQKVLPQEFINLTSENKNFELKAEYKLLDYKINYNLDGGVLETANPGAINIENTDGIVLENIPKKEGYTFDGWELEDADADNYVELTKAADSNVYTIKFKTDDLPADNDGIKIKAKWIENTITLQLKDEKGIPYFDADDNGIVVNCKYENRNNCKIDFAPSVSDDKEFIGWEANGIITKSGSAFSNVALYTEPTLSIETRAVFLNKNRYNIEYDLDGGSFTDDASPVLSFELGREVVPLPGSTVVSKKGYIFGGWIKYVPSRPAPTDENGDSEEPSPTDESEEPNEPAPITQLENPRADVKVIAKWTPITYTVKLHNGSNVIDTITCTYDVACSLKDHHATFNKTNFIGWGKDANTLEYGDNTEVTNLASTNEAVVNLYAVNGSYHNVSFYLDGGVLETPISINDVISVGDKNKDMTVDLTGVTPTKEGYNFVGWLNGTNTVNGEVNITSDTLFIAKWEKITYTVKLYYGPEHSSNKEILVKYGDKVSASDIGELDISGKWMIGTTEIADLATELENPIISNKEYKRVYNVQLLDKDNIKNVEVVAGEKAIDKFTDANVLNGKWFIDDAATSISDLSNYLTNTAIVKNHVITKAKAVVFSDSTGNVLEFDVKFNGKLDVTKLTDAVIEHDWYLGETLINGSQLAVHFSSKVVTEDLNYVRAYTITFDDTTSNKYSAKYNEKFDKTKLDASILDGQWYLEDTFTNLDNYFDNNKIMGDLVFSKVYSVNFWDNGSAVSPSPYFVKYNSNLNFESLTETIKNSTWIVGENMIVLEDYLRDHPISSNVSFYKAYSVEIIYNGGPKKVYVKAGDRADNKFTNEELSGYWLKGDQEINDLKNYLANPVNENLTFTKLYTVSLEHSSKTDKDIVKVPYNMASLDKFETNGINFSDDPYNGVWVLENEGVITKIENLSSYLQGWNVINDLTIYRAYTVKLESSENVVSVAVKEGNKAIAQLQDNITAGDIWFNGDTEVEIESYLNETPINSDITLKKAYKVTLASGTTKEFNVPFNEKAISKIIGIDFGTEPYNGKWKNNSDIINPGDLEAYLNDLTVEDNITISTIATFTLKYNGGPKEVTVVAGRVNMDELSEVPISGTWFENDTEITDLATHLSTRIITDDLELIKGYTVTLEHSGKTEKDTVIVPYNTTSLSKFEANGIDFDTEPYNGAWTNDSTSILEGGLKQHLFEKVITGDTIISKNT